MAKKKQKVVILRWTENGDPHERVHLSGVFSSKSEACRLRSRFLLAAIEDLAGVVEGPLEGIRRLIAEGRYIEAFDSWNRIIYMFDLPSALFRFEERTIDSLV